MRRSAFVWAFSEDEGTSRRRAGARCSVRVNEQSARKTSDEALNRARTASTAPVRVCARVSACVRVCGRARGVCVRARALPEKGPDPRVGEARGVRSGARELARHLRRRRRLVAVVDALPHLTRWSAAREKERQRWRSVPTQACRARNLVEAGV
eukprot:3906277-Pleurochrysis_carterae.AAC.2